MNDGRAHAQGKIGDISTTGHPIHFMFGSGWGFRGRRILEIPTSV